MIDQRIYNGLKFDDSHQAARKRQLTPDSIVNGGAMGNESMFEGVAMDLSNNIYVRCDFSGLAEGTNFDGAVLLGCTLPDWVTPAHLSEAVGIDLIRANHQSIEAGRDGHFLLRYMRHDGIDPEFLMQYLLQTSFEPKMIDFRYYTERILKILRSIGES